MLNCQVLTEKLSQNKSKNLLVENNLKKLKTFYSSYIIGKSHFEEDGTQNYLVIYRYTDILKWFLVLLMAVTFIVGNLKDCLTKELIRTKKSNHSINPNLDYYGIKPRVDFNRGCLKQGKVTFNQGQELNI